MNLFSFGDGCSSLSSPSSVEVLPFNKEHKKVVEQLIQNYIDIKTLEDHLVMTCDTDLPDDVRLMVHQDMTSCHGSTADDFKMCQKQHYDNVYEKASCLLSTEQYCCDDFYFDENNSTNSMLTNSSTKITRTSEILVQQSKKCLIDNDTTSTSSAKDMNDTQNDLDDKHNQDLNELAVELPMDRTVMKQFYTMLQKSLHFGIEKLVVVPYEAVTSYVIDLCKYFGIFIIARFQFSICIVYYVYNDFYITFLFLSEVVVNILFVCFTGDYIMSYITGKTYADHLL